MSNDLLDLFLSSTEDYGIILLDPDGLVHRWSRGAERLFGFEAHEVEGTPAHEIFVPPDRKAGVPEIELRTAAEQGRAEDERWHMRKDGTRFWASGVMIALSENGALRGYAKVVRDFTERRKLEEAVRQTQRLESVGVLAAGVAHDFNNVLTAIIGNVSLVRRRLAAVGAADGIDDMLDSAERASQRAADLVKQLLNYAGKGRREMQPVDICQVTADALAIVQASVSRKITISRDVPEDCRLIQADVGQLQQLVLNLVLNGAEAIGEKEGEVSIRVRVRDVPEAELTRFYAGFSLPVARPYTEIQVSDTGVGMDEETLQRIFDPFYTTKFLGRGLGLAAALGIVRSHGGGIAVQSAPGRGTSFTVLLPAEQDTGDAPLTVSESITESARGEGLVLVVDDEVTIRSMLQHILEELGYTVLTAEHGAQALELFERVSQEIKLVLLDLVMPVLDGPETAVALHARQPDVPILVMSGIADDDALRRFGNVRIAGFVPKPFAPDQLAQAVAVARQGLKWAGKDRREERGTEHSGQDRRGAAPHHSLPV
ncbi:MAG: two-component system, chemotaxis family, CheB/CheR fusion protein [Gemmatimonadales bacterium]|nr:two-component system, chemotaxis family, CheB/CheR fusion protein [Gemmatimonadales bacterium]